MQKIFSGFLLAILAGAALSPNWETPAGEGAKPFVNFRMQELSEKLTVDYAVLLVDVNGNGKSSLISVPLMGRGSCAKNNHMDGQPLRLTAYRIPKDPVKDCWVPEVLDESLHVAHNFHPIDVAGTSRKNSLVASYEGVSLL